MSRHLSTRNISSKPMHTFLSNLANRQTDKQTLTNTCTSSFVRGKNSPGIREGIRPGFHECMVGMICGIDR